MYAKKFFGQHFLRDASVLEAIVEAARVTGGEVLEIGPGEGVLTALLVEQAARVVAVDIDAEAIATTRARVPSDRLELIEGDVLHMGADLRALLQPGYVLVGNLPYNITSEILRWALSAGNKPARAVVMMQREVADKLLASAGDLSLLGLMVQIYASPRRVVAVPRGAFAPPPKVDSMVVALDVYSDTDLDARGVSHPEKLIAFAGVAFAQKRKQLKSTLGSLSQVSPAQLIQLLAERAHPATARPQELSTEDWIYLYNHIHGYC